MNAGLPGTGLGGLFYIICALFMPINELVLTLRGKSTWRRWLTVARQFSMALGIVVSLRLTYALMALMDAPNTRDLLGRTLAQALDVAFVALVLLSTPDLAPVRGLVLSMVGVLLLGQLSRLNRQVRTVTPARVQTAGSAR